MIIYTYVYMYTGIYYPKGGFIKISEALESISESLGVKIIKSCHVTSVKKDVDKDEYIVTFGDNNDHVRTKRVISNMDVPAFEASDLLPFDQRDTNVHAYRSSISVLSLSIAFDFEITCLDHHTLFFSDDYSGSWDCVEKSGRKDDGRPEFNVTACNFYVHAPSRTDHSVCPTGHDAITVLVPIPLLSMESSHHNDADEIDDAFIKSVRNEVLLRLSKAQEVSYTELEQHIVVEKHRAAKAWQSVSVVIVLK